MWKQVRAFGLMFVCAFTFWGTVSKAEGYLRGHLLLVPPARLFDQIGHCSTHRYLRVRDAQLLLEHLIRQSDALLSEVNLVRAGGFAVAPVVLQALPQRSWEGSFYGMILANRQMPVDAQVATQLQSLRVNALMFYDLSYKLRPNDPRLLEQFTRLNRSYHNAVAANFFYIETLRRTFIIRNCVGSTRNLPTLIRRLRNMEALGHQLMEVMHIIRHCATYRFPLPQHCLECGRASVHINITYGAPERFLSVPFYTSNQWYAPTGADEIPAHPGTYRPNYDMSGNTQRWTYYDTQQGGDYDQQPQYPRQSGQQLPTYPVQPGQGGGYQQPQYPIQPGQQQQYPIQQPGQGGGYNPLPPPQSGDGAVPSRDYDL